MADLASATRTCAMAAAGHLEPGTRAILGCSGGPDSIALVAAVSRAAREELVSIDDVLAVVVDHGIQEQSSAQAERAAALCAQLGVRAEVVTALVRRESGDGLEAAARAARYEVMERAAIDFGSDRVLLGHTREDQAETVLLRLARGSGARTLAAMAPVAPIPSRTGRLHDASGVDVRRPFLHLPRSLVHSTVADLPTWLDPHNSDPSFLRARVRHELLPTLIDVLGSGAVEGLARTADLLRDDADALDAWAEAAYTDACRSEPGATLEFDIDRLSGLPRAVRSRVLRLGAIRSGSPAGALTADHVARVAALIESWRGQGEVALPGGIGASRRCGRLCLGPISWKA